MKSLLPSSLRRPTTPSYFKFRNFGLQVGRFSKLQIIPPFDIAWFRLFPFRSPLLRESRLLSFPRVTEMFQFARFPSRFARDDAALPAPGFPIRKSPDHSLQTAPRGFSQSATSFIGSGHQGIHRMPSSAFCRHSLKNQLSRCRQLLWSGKPAYFSFKKVQPHLPVRLPCYSNVQPVGPA